MRSTPPAAIIRPLRKADLAEADRVFRVAFGTQFGLADPTQFRGDAELIRPRWATDPRPCFAAEIGGRIVGSVVGMDWGSAFVVGPLSVEPAHANRGIGRRLMAAIMAFADARRFPLTALYTLPNSAKHLHLYESYGFHARYLTPVMAKVVNSPVVAPAPHPSLSPQVERGLLGVGEAGAEPYTKLGEGISAYSRLDPIRRTTASAACRAVAEAVFPGLDLGREIAALAAQSLGETVLLERGGSIVGFALCHFGKGSEAGSGTLYVKFACVRPNAAEDFAALLDACETLAAVRGIWRVVAGTNMAREAAYRIMRERGYRAESVGVSMLRPAEPGWNRPDVFALDDWR
ncbi:MAG: GNAT family N-acetyltransferase [Stellaceae bacterium]